LFAIIFAMNKTNLELKHFCSDFHGVRKVLKTIGAKKEVVKNQKDFFFELPKRKIGNPRLKLRIENRKETLIYYDRPNFKKEKETKATIKLYKVHDKELLPFLKESLGVKAIVEKKREVWRKDNTVFHLDDVKGVGKIFEVELQRFGKINQKDINIFKKYQTELLPHLGPVIRGSNVDLVKKLGI
jgi:adenylate cyclase class 2